MVVELKPTLSGSYQMVFEGCFKNNTKEQIESHISGHGDHCLWLQGPLNFLTREQRTNYIIAILLRILEFLSV